jgi:hypothetical protein
MSDCSESDDESIDSADIVVVMAKTTTPEPKAPIIEPTVPSIIHTSATSTRILIEFIRKDTLSQLDGRPKKGPDLSESILEEIGNASISLFNRRARRCSKLCSKRCSTWLMMVGGMRQDGAKRGWAAERRGFECSGCGGGATRVRMQWMWQ